MRETCTTFLRLIVATALASGAAFGGEEIRREDLIGTLSTELVGAEDTLLDIARRRDLGFVELLAANPGVDPWLPEPNSRVELPTAHVLPDIPRHGIAVNVADQRLYYFHRNTAKVTTYPIGTPRDGKFIPMGVTKIVGKRKNPTWHPPASLRQEDPDLPKSVPPGPDNPLGDFALDTGWTGIVIHGTNKPYGIGRRVSAGCIRLYPEDIVNLFKTVPNGERVTVVDQAVKAGWSDKLLYLEIHPSGRQVDAIEEDGRLNSDALEPLPELEAYLTKKAGQLANRIDWRLVAKVASERTGIPVAILHRP